MKVSRFAITLGLFALFLHLQLILSVFSPTTYIGLKLVYDSTNGPGWLFSTGLKAWNFSDSNVNPCAEQWTGLICDTGNTTVLNLVLDEHRLVGELPGEAFKNFSALEDLSMAGNMLQGTIPTSIYDLTKIRRLNLARNQFTEVSENIVNLNESLLLLYLRENKLHGSLGIFARLKNLRVLSVGSNGFTGPLSSLIPMLSKLYVIDCSNNYLGSTIPNSISALKNLTFINFQKNSITGTLPSSISSLRQLQLIEVGENSINGPLDGRFHSSQASLLSIDLSANSFTGHIPSTLFQLPNITAIAMVSNAFSGSLPIEICSAAKMSVLAMGGLTSAGPGILKEYMSGSIPPCVLTLPELYHLNLAGNGFTGTLPGILPISKLKILSLSHNQLTGKISESIQSHYFQSLDLSYNKLSGLWESDRVHQMNLNSSSIKIQQNRISGVLPTYFVDYGSAQVLSGNLWACSDTDLPESDPNHLDYDCNTQLYTDSMIVWAFFTGIGLVIGVLYFWSGTRDRKPPEPGRSSHPKNFQELKKLIYDYTMNFSEYASKASIKFSDWAAGVEFCNSDITDVKGYLYCMTYQMRTSAIITSFLLLFCVPIFPSLKSAGYQTHWRQQSWQVSGAFFTGLAPAGCYFMIWSIAVSLLLWRLLRAHRKVGLRLKFSKDKVISDSKIAPDVKWKSVLIIISMTVVSFAIVIGVNIFYVIQQTSKNSARGTNLALLLFLTWFKISWGTVFVPLIMAYMRKKIILGRTNFMRLKILLVLFNNIIAPFVASIFSDPACFRGMIYPDDGIDFSYNVETCIPIDPNSNSCQPFSVYENYSFQPPFFYNNMCSSILFAYYIPIYMYSYVIFAFFIPIAYVFAATTKSEKLPKWVFVILPGILWPKDPTPSKFPFMFDPEDVSASQLQHFTTLLTFGLASPILAVAITIAMCMEMFTWQVMLGRYIIQSKEVSDKVEGGGDDHLQAANAKLNEACKNAWRRPLGCSWLVFWTSAFFYMFVTLDIASDKVLVAVASWCPVLVACVPVCLWLYKKYFSKLMLREYAASVVTSVKDAGRRVSMRLGRSSTASGGISVEQLEAIRAEAAATNAQKAYSETKTPFASFTDGLNNGSGKSGETISDRHNVL